MGRRYRAQRKARSAEEGEGELKVGAPDDRFEQQADRVADKAVQMNPKEEEEPALQMKPEEEEEAPLRMKEEEEKALGETPKEDNGIFLKEEEENAVGESPEKDESVHLKEEEEVVQAQEEEEEEPVQTKKEEEEIKTKTAIQRRGDQSTPAPKSVSSEIKQSKGQGQPMEEGIQQEMGQKIGMDFSGVNIHTDGKAARMSDQLGAKAFTHGKDIYFNKGNYDPRSSQGKHLLAHELTHTVQQGATPAQTRGSGSQVPGIQKAEDLSASRFAGNRYLERVFDGNSYFSKSRNRQGRHVTLVQNALLAMGYDLPRYGADGVFGDETEAAVRAFQVDAGATMLDGIIGSETMRLLDMQDPGGSTSTGPPATPVPTAAVFSESPSETFAGYDDSVAPNWLVVPVNERRRANVAITPANTTPTFVSDNPAVATVDTTDDGIVVTGISHGTANITAMNGPHVLATLRISVKDQLDRSVAFHYVCDSRGAAAGGPHCSNGSPSADEMRALLNRVWHRQANVRFTGGTAHNVVVPGDLGAAVDWTTGAPGGGEWATVTATGTGADYNVFRVWNYLQDGAGTNGGANLGNNTMLADATCADGWGLPHECGHFLGLGHGTGFIMTPCGGRANQRVSKAQVDSVNP